MQVLTIYDFVLLPLYLFAFYFFVKRKAVSLTDDKMRRIFLISFGLRMLGSVAYVLLVQYYYGFGDSMTYYRGSDYLVGQLWDNPANFKYFFAPATEFQQWYNAEVGDIGLSGYLGISSSNIIMKISAILAFVSFNKFMIISLFFGLFSFAGQWKLFQVFNDYNKGKNLKLLAYAVLYSPSIWFWGSGLMKDSICLGATGFIISILYNNFVKKNIRFGQWLFLFVCLLLVYTVKNYIVIIIFVIIVIVMFVRYLQSLKNMFTRALLIFSFLILTILILNFADFTSQINGLVEESVLQVKTFQSQYQSIQSQDETSKAGFDIGNINESLTGLILKSPSAIFTCLYRPFLWESRKLIILLTSLESTFLLLVTLYLLFKTRFTGFFVILFSNSFYLFSFLVSILFALVIGFTTFNFGSIVRYKIILLPFYYFMLVGIYTKMEERKAEKLLGKTT